MRGPTLHFFASCPHVLRLLKAGGDDAVLRGFLGVLERQGFTVVGVGDVAHELLVPEGGLTKASPSPEDAADIARGFDLVAALGRYDIGQAVDREPMAGSKPSKVRKAPTGC